MITIYEHSDIVHIMKMNRLKLIDSNTAHLEFGGLFNGKNYQINITVVEESPTVVIKREKEVVFTDTVRSVDDLKIFLEEQVYKYLEV